MIVAPTAQEGDMCEVPVFYATNEGQTRRIADRIAERVRKHGFDSRAIAIISDEAAHVEWNRARGAVVGASIHIGKHQGEAVAFARLYHRELSVLPSLFVSVSLSAASKNLKEKAAAEHIAQKFVVDTGWRPSRIASVAGRLAYTQYNWFVRVWMRQIAKKEGASIDTNQDHEYTDWTEIERLADELADGIRRREGAPHDAAPSVRLAS